MLVGGFIEEEIREAVWSCDCTKSPDPDGFNFGFIKFYWDVIKKDVVSAVMDFAVSDKWPRVSKLLSLRMKKVISRVIHVRQLTFLKGKGLLDSVVITNEVLDEVKRKKRSCIFIKVDYEKAYDSVSWEFILYMLKMVGFCDKWIHWIKSCLDSTSVSMLVNDSPTKEFFS